MFNSKFSVSVVYPNGIQAPAAPQRNPVKIDGAKPKSATQLAHEWTSKVINSEAKLVDALQFLAPRYGIEFDTTVTRANDPKKPNTIIMAARLTQGEMHFTEASEAEFAEGYSQYLEAYAKRMQTLAQTLRTAFHVKQPVVDVKSDAA